MIPFIFFGFSATNIVLFFSNCKVEIAKMHVAKQVYLSFKVEESLATDLLLNCLKQMC